MANFETTDLNQRRYEALVEVHRQKLAELEFDSGFTPDAKTGLKTRLRQNFLSMSTRIPGHQNECVKINGQDVVLPDGSTCSIQEAVNMGYKPVLL